MQLKVVLIYKCLNCPRVAAACIKWDIQWVPDLCTFVVKTILAICIVDSWYRKAMTVSSNMGGNIVI